MEELCDDLAAEQEALDGLVEPLDDAGYETPTPAPGWTIRDQLHHLGYFDRAAALAVRQPDAFLEQRKGVTADARAYEARRRDESTSLAGRAVLGWWRAGRREALDALRGAPPSMRVPWYGPDMALRSFATARLMETWAHGLDVADALGAGWPATGRLRHVAHLGVRTRGFSYAVRGLSPPEEEVRVVLEGPDGEAWTWGPEDAPARVEGPAFDFCAVVTQRRHPDETTLVATGAAATGWLAIAQAFAGPPGPGRPPLAVP